MKTLAGLMLGISGINCLIAGDFSERINSLRCEATNPVELQSAYSKIRAELPEFTQVLDQAHREAGKKTPLLLFSKNAGSEVESEVLATLQQQLRRLLPDAPNSNNNPSSDEHQRLDFIDMHGSWNFVAATLKAADADFPLDRLQQLDRELGPIHPLLSKIQQSGVRERLLTLKLRTAELRTALFQSIINHKPADANAARDHAAMVQKDAAIALRFALCGHGAGKIVYATRTHHGRGHFYESIGYYGPDGSYNYSKSGGKLVIWDAATASEQVLIDDSGGGALRDPCVSWDARTILFSWRRAGSHYYHLYTIPAAGGEPVQLTDGLWNDIEPIWSPDGGIIFSSSRCHRWIPCNLAEVANLHRCDGDGKNIRMISSNVETEGAPWMLPDGRVIYMRWEYTEKDRAVFHNLWTSNPDGTNHQIYFGNIKDLTDVWNDPKPIPGTDAVVFVAHNHGGPEHKGTIAIVDSLGGPNDHSRIRYVTAPYRSVETPWRDPFPVCSDLFLAARGSALVVLDDDGRECELFSLPIADKGTSQALVHEPRVLAPRPREHRIPDRTDLSKDHGEFILADVYEGRYLDGVKRGDVKDLLIIEELPKPVHHDGHTEPLCYNGTFMLERVLGCVPVEEDGSAYFKAPPLRSLMFVARDKDGLSVKRMQSFATTMPGERQSCIGCHENRTRVAEAERPLLALKRPPSDIQPFPGIPEVFDFPRDIQPILNRNCLPCHDGNRREGGVVLDDDMDVWFSQSYVTLQTREMIGTGFRALMAGMGPREVGSSASELVRYLREGHQGIKPTAQEIRKVSLWVDSAGVWAGTYAAVNTTNDAQPAFDEKLAAILGERCASCHEIKGSWETPIALLRTPSPATGPDLGEKYGLRINLSDVRRSLLLRAPLAKQLGGLALCKDKAGNPVAIWSGPHDPGYLAVLHRMEVMRDLLVPLRYDRPGFRPLPTYVREMKRQNLIPQDFDIHHSPWDPYELDRQYWKSFWHQPGSRH